jgi:oligopeptide/dipeptide ABC transporter ATP-binding protein
MEQGAIREIGTREHLYTNPQHPYTQALIAAVPEPDPREERRKLTARRAATAAALAAGAPAPGTNQPEAVAR